MSDTVRTEACGCRLQLVADPSGDERWERSWECTAHVREHAQRGLAMAREALAAGRAAARARRGRAA